MVSLSRSSYTNSGGATFFNDSLTMEGREYLQPILESYGLFKPLRTLVPFCVHQLALVAIEALALVFTFSERLAPNRCREYYILIYVHVALWWLTLIVDQIARVRHHNLRMNGYLEFYKTTSIHHQLPFYVVSLWTAAILFLQTLMQHFYPEDFTSRCLKIELFSPITYVCVLFTLEFCLLTTINILYIVKVRKFNNQQPPPDVQKEDWIACSSAESFAQGEIGYKQLGDKVYDFIEKQADLIRHLKDHNARLGEKLMVLNAQMTARAGHSQNQ